MQNSVQTFQKFFQLNNTILLTYAQSMLMKFIAGYSNKSSSLVRVESFKYPSLMSLLERIMGHIQTLKSFYGTYKDTLGRFPGFHCDDDDFSNK